MNSSTQNDLQRFVVVSWNVLHMIHELNYVHNNSSVINRYSINTKPSNEKLRLNDIANIVNDLLTRNNKLENFICLQEVPGDLILILRNKLQLNVGGKLFTKPLIHVHTYQRVPQLKSIENPRIYTNPDESLVTIHYNPNVGSVEETKNLNNEELLCFFNDKIAWTSCPTDPGKGALTLETESGLTIVNIHIPYNNTAANILLGNIAWPRNDKAFVLTGDMNRHSDRLMDIIKQISNPKSFQCLSPVETSKPTRVGLDEHGMRIPSWIDHFVVSTSLKSSIKSPVIVYDEVGDVSDHYPISLQFN